MKIFFNRWIVACLGLVLVTVFLLYNTGFKDVDNSQDDPIVLGVVVTESEDDWHDKLYDNIISSVEKNGIRTMKIETQRTQSAQIEAIRSFVVYGVNGIVFCPVVDN